MKKLIVTGDQNCMCRGTGIIEKVVAGLDLNNREQPFVKVTVRTLCDCVKTEALPPLTK